MVHWFDPAAVAALPPRPQTRELHPAALTADWFGMLTSICS